MKQKKTITFFSYQDQTNINYKKKKIVFLNYRYFDEGFEEGQIAGKIAGIHEGAEFGIQTAFQRYIAIGVLLGRIEVWKRQIEAYKKQASSMDSNDDNEKKDLEKFITKASTSVASLEKMLSPSSIPMTNSDEDVAKLEVLIRKAKSKAKIISNLMKDSSNSSSSSGNDGASLETKNCSCRQGAETSSNKCCSTKDNKKEEDAGDSDDLSAPIEYHDGRISQMLRPLDEVIEDFRI